jgi:hypothetical protein
MADSVAKAGRPPWNGQLLSIPDVRIRLDLSFRCARPSHYVHLASAPPTSPRDRPAPAFARAHSVDPAVVVTRPGQQSVTPTGGATDAPLAHRLKVLEPFRSAGLSVQLKCVLRPSPVADRDESRTATEGRPDPVGPFFSLR